uniref:sensor histidine kinase n=1 Tax=Streptomyces flavofungini TaxID=68200 RepID=UPI0034DE393B
MKETVRAAGRAMAQLGKAGGLAVLSYLFMALILFTAVVTLLVVGAAVLPETVLLLRRTSGLKRRLVAGWTGEPLPEAYAPLTGGVRERVRAALKDPGTWRDLRWLVAHFVYGTVLLYVAIPLFILGLLADGFWCGLLRQRAVALPLLDRLADLDAAWSRALLLPSPEARRNAGLAERVEELTVTRAGAVAAHGAELRRIERDLHDGTQARLVSLSMRVGLARRAWDKDPEAARKLLD